MLDKWLVIPASFSTTDGSRPSFLAYLFLIMLCVGFFTPGLVTMPPTDRDESSFAQASKQMIETGDYVDIRLQKEPRYKKPIGIYWLQTVAVRLFNPNHLNEIWAYRLPSFAGATIAVLMTAALGALLFSPATGLVAGMMLASCVLLNVEARLAKTDAALLGCIMVMMYGLARAYLNQIGDLKVPFFFWTAISIGVLLKGPIVLLPLVSVLIWMKASNKTLAWFRLLRPIKGIVLALILILPWFVAISLQSHGLFMDQSAGHDMFAKIWQGQNRGAMPPGLHLMALPLVFFPFALFAVFAAPDMWKNRHDRAVKFCLAWAIPTWLVFEASLTKLPHYVLPAYPALALLTAKFLLDGLPTVAATSRRVPIVLAVGFWLVIGLGFAITGVLLPSLSDNLWSWPQICAGVILILSQGAALLLLPKQKAACVAAVTVGSLIFLTTLFGTTLPALNHIWMSREIADAMAQHQPCEASQLVSVGYHEPSLAFLVGTDTLMAVTGQEAAEALKADPCRVISINQPEEQKFLDGLKNLQASPLTLAKISGLNSGHGAQTAVTLYTLAHVTQ